MILHGSAYLTIPEQATSSWELHWSDDYDGIQDGYGTTILLKPELELILAGVFRAPPVPSLVSVLLVLQQFRLDLPTPQFATLKKAYVRALQSEGVRRHLGMLISELCRPFPPSALQPSWEDVQSALALLTSDAIRYAATYVVLPSHTAQEFVKLVGQELQKYSLESLEHFLKFGTHPTDAGEELATEVDTLPQVVDAVLTAAQQNRRLVGAAFLTPVLDAAMTLPARGQTVDTLPLGGYADVTTRGDPDRLLLSQFALDPDDFVRRFAERELLYFKREEPHAPVPPQRIIILDQGVRTWGGVRLALAAATLTLLKQNPPKAPMPALYLTSQKTPVSVAVNRADDLVKALEASDFTRNPAAPLMAICSEPESETPRDILLLTHTRSAAESELLVVAQQVRPIDRLFVLTVSDNGMSQLLQWTGRGPVPVRSFRVDLAGAERAEPLQKQKQAAAVAQHRAAFHYQPWQGDVKKIPFPFRPGLLLLPDVFGFDVDGKWCVCSGANGVVHAIDTTTGSVEVLPSPFRTQRGWDSITHILPMHGGVVVCGTAAIGWDFAVTDSATTPTETEPLEIHPSDPIQEFQAHHVAAHYDFAARTMKLFVFPTTASQSWVRWYAYPDLQTVVFQCPAGNHLLTVDLASQIQRAPFETTTRTEQARGRNTMDAPGAIALPINPVVGENQPNGPYARVKDNSIVIIVFNAARATFMNFTPTEDGKPLLDGATMMQNRLARDVFAFSYMKGIHSELRVHRGSQATSLGVIKLTGLHHIFMLSPDGSKIAWVHDRHQVNIAETNRLPNLLVKPRLIGLHNATQMQAYCYVDHEKSEVGMILGVGQFQHDLTVRRTEFVAKRITNTINIMDLTTAAAREKLNRKLPDHFSQYRYSIIGGAECGCIRIIADKLGQMIIVNRANMILFHVLMKRDKIALWTVEGGYWGDPDLIGGAPTPGAEQAIIAAIRKLMEKP